MDGTKVQDSVIINVPTKATRAAIKSTWNEPKTLSQLGTWNVTCPYTSAPAVWLYRPLDTSWRRRFRHLAATRRQAQKQARNSVTLEATEALPLLRHRPSSSSAAATLARLGISVPLSTFSATSCPKASAFRSARWETKHGPHPQTRCRSATATLLPYRLPRTGWSHSGLPRV